MNLNLRTQQHMQLNMAGPPFLGPQGPQSQPQPPHMAMMSGNPNPANPMTGLLMSSNGPANTNYQLQMQAQRRNYMQQGGHAPPGMNPALGPAPSHVNGLAPNQMGFQNAIMQQNGTRRVLSQPNGLNQSGGSLGGGIPGQQIMQGLNGMAGMTIPTQLRQQMPPQGQQMRPPPQIPGSGGIPSDMQMGLNRPGGMNGAPAFPHLARAPSQPSIPNIPQPPSLPQTHAGGMQQPFAANMSLAQSMHNQQSQALRSSPQTVQVGPPGSHSNPIPGPSGPPGNVNQQQMAHERMPFNFPGSQMPPNMQPGVHRMAPGGVPMGYNTAPNTPGAQLGVNQSLGDMPPSLSGGNLGGQQRSTSRQGGGGLVATPVQAMDALNNMNGESFSGPFNIHPQNPPPRPLSQQQRQSFQMAGQQQQQQPQQQPMPPHMAAHRSPRQPDMVQQMQMQRPGSQPQVASGPSPQRTAPSNTPRTMQSQLPQQSGMNPNRTPSLASAQLQGHPPPPKPPTPATPANIQQVPIVTHPSQSPPTITSHSVQSVSHPAPGPAPPESGPPPPTHAPPHPPNLSPQRPQQPAFVAPQIIGRGESTLRLLSFSGALASESQPVRQQKLQLSYWEELVSEYFTSKATFKFTLWKDNQRLEAKPFEIGVPILPRFFLVTAQSGVKCMTLSLDGARERQAGPTHGVVECIMAVWTYKYHNGWTVTLRGPMTAHVLAIPNVPSPNPSYAPGTYTLKFDQLQFDAQTFEKLITAERLAPNFPNSPGMPSVPLPAGEAPTSQTESVVTMDSSRPYEDPRWKVDRVMLPMIPINGFGIPQATMRCLELAESVTQMSDLIQFSVHRNLGPKQALTEFAKQLRESQSQEAANVGLRINGTGGPHNGPSPPGAPGGGGGGMYDTSGSSGSSTASSSTLYSGPSQTNQSQQQPLPHHQNGSLVMDGTPKQSKAIPQSGPSASTPSASTPAASTPTAATMTPVTAPETLKRKAGDSSSPSISNADPPPNAKRARAKRRSTATG
ncbi:hypothetical protein BDW22DRAFT_1425038 [Trametopsis cervina]|nr:hypothetical protein BDW22DRAFT_1425038 [Trametopsis cervina]